MRTTDLAPLLPALVSAQWPYYLRGDANSSAPSYNSPAFLAAAAEPNATHEVSFARTNISGNTDWTWTLSITDMQVPEGIPQSEEETGLQLDPVASDARVAYTSYHFSWPEDGTIDQAVSREDSRSRSAGVSCYYNLDVMFPQNVSDAWDSSSSSCSSAIGEACANLIISSLPSIEVTECQSGSFPWRDIYQAPECGPSFRAGTNPQGTSANAYALGNTTASANSIEQNETYAWKLSDIYSPQNETAFLAEKNRLHMVALSSPFGSQLICNRIGSGLNTSSADEGESGGDDTSAGSSVGHSSTMLLLVTAAAALLASALLI